jgi:nitrite reductase/ring-hydroxylating ferredoxin subunit
MTDLLESIEQGWTLPSQWYRDPEIFREEQRRIHRRSWHYVTHTGTLVEPGDVFPWEIGGVPIVLVKQADGSIGGYENICRHRAYPVVQEAGSQRSLTCHYHGWTYDLGGALVNAPKANGPLGFELGEMCLPRVQVAVWGPMVWVNPSLDAPSFDEWTLGMDDLLLERGCDVTQAAHATEATWEIGANWKVFQDNTIECYHCPTTHPEFSRAVVQDPARQVMAVGGRWWIHHSIPFREGIPEGPTYVPDTYFYNWVFPATYLQHSGKGFDIGTIDIVAVDRLVFRHMWFAPIGTPPETIALAQRQLDADPTIPQDVEICKLVQRSHDSGVAPAGRLLQGREALLTHFYKVIAEMMERDA